MNLSTETNGDTALIAAVQRELEGSSRNHASAAFIEDTQNFQWVYEWRIRYANFGVTNDTQYEIGSLSKVMLGHLFADAVQRGEVTPEQTLGSLAPVSGAAAGITLDQLATHTGGFPHYAETFSNVADLWADAAVQINPAWVGEYHYSNMGAALLGQALAERAGLPYRDYINARLFAPLGMTNSLAPVFRSGIPAGSPNGYDPDGTPQPPNTGQTYAPAFGVRASIADLATFGLAVLQSTAPGMDAVVPRLQFEPNEWTGWFWGYRTENNRVTLRKSGSTDGFSAYIELDRDNRQGIVLLSDVESSTADAGRRLLYSGGL